MDRATESPRASLSPTLSDRLTALTRPGRARVTLARRVTAAALTALAAVLLVRGDRDGDTVPVVTAARDLAPGAVLRPEDLRLTPLRTDAVPNGVVRRIDEATGRTLAGPARAGEPLTDVRVLGPRLAGAAAGVPDARVVPIRLADPEVTDLLREGDRVDVLALAGDRSPDARVLATDAAVVLVSPQDSGRTVRERVVLLALPADTAAAVAAASLSDALTVTFH
ncbi:SAF domain-containing protein [Rhodococcus kronopolitis]|uniref:SAF domain-containing protein n=1 Tax=Rhodococcus kronopolitis TaxID=1460226 RepID=A0ABV9FPY2_9NOCA